MRKVSWLAMGCVAAFVAQALIAADNAKSVTSKDSATGRSRLLIFSRQKEKVTKPEEEDEAPATAQVRQAPQRTLTPAQVRNAAARAGNTGTVSPQGSLTRQIPSARANTATRPSQAELAPSTDDDELNRLLFEADEQAALSLQKPAKPATKPAAQPVARRTETTARRAETTARDKFDEFETDEFATSETAANEAAASEFDIPEAELPKVDRYRDLLESSSATKSGTNARAENLKKSSIQRVSKTPDDNHELDVNAFEAAERPTKVVNAGFESDSGNPDKPKIQRVSATGPNALRATPKAQLATSTKPPVVKKPEAAKTDAQKTATKLPVVATKPATTTNSTSTIQGENQTPQVDVQWEARGEVTLGQECQCALVVHNSGRIPCRDLVVEANFPESVRLVDAKPFPKGASAKLEWQFTNLAAGEKKIIELTMIPTKPGELAASAQVRFTGTAATSFKVSEPMLATTVKLPTEVRLGEPTSATVTVSNPGTGTAQNVVLKASLPAGLECKSGREFESDIGPLGPGESRVVRVALVAAAGGEHALKVVARSTTSELETTSQANIKVLAPSLTLTASGPGLRYLNRAAKYVLTATNNSNAASDNVRISQIIERGFEFVKADHSGRWDAERRTVSWFIGHMEPGQSISVELDLMPKNTGEFRQQFRVAGDSGVEASTVVVTRVEGAASLVMEVKDAEDPIEVGTNMTYVIKVRNEGSKSAGKVAVSCELPPDVELVSVDGPTQHLVESGMLIFKPVAELAANDTSTFKVTIKSLAAGTMKLRARLTSESIQKPLIIEEATQFYAE